MMKIDDDDLCWDYEFILPFRDWAEVKSLFDFLASEDKKEIEIWEQESLREPISLNVTYHQFKYTFLSFILCVGKRHTYISFPEEDHMKDLETVAKEAIKWITKMKDQLHPWNGPELDF